jgi:hypothetical protein
LHVSHRLVEIIRLAPFLVFLLSTLRGGRGGAFGAAAGLLLGRLGRENVPESVRILFNANALVKNCRKRRVKRTYNFLSNFILGKTDSASQVLSCCGPLQAPESEIRVVS